MKDFRVTIEYTARYGGYCRRSVVVTAPNEVSAYCNACRVVSKEERLSVTDIYFVRVTEA